MQIWIIISGDTRDFSINLLNAYPSVQLRMFLFLFRVGWKILALAFKGFFERAASIALNNSNNARCKDLQSDSESLYEFDSYHIVLQNYHLITFAYLFCL